MVARNDLSSRQGFRYSQRRKPPADRVRALATGSVAGSWHAVPGARGTTRRDPDAASRCSDAEGSRIVNAIAQAMIDFDN